MSKRCTRSSEIASENESALLHGWYLWFYTRVRHRISSDTPPTRSPEFVSLHRRNFRRKAVVVEFGHQMSLRRGGLPSGVWDLKPQQRGLIGARSMDKSADTSFLCDCHVLPWFLFKPFYLRSVWYLSYNFISNHSFHIIYDIWIFYESIFLS